MTRPFWRTITITALRIARAMPALTAAATPGPAQPSTNSGKPRTPRSSSEPAPTTTAAVGTMITSRGDEQRAEDGTGHVATRLEHLLREVGRRAEAVDDEHGDGEAGHQDAERERRQGAVGRVPAGGPAC